MSLTETLQRARAAKDPGQLIDAIPYARLIGMTCLNLGDELVFKLPAQESNIGFPVLPSLHGGVIGGFMETSAVLHVLMHMETPHIPKVVDFSIDYLRAGRLLDSYASCHVVRQGRKVVNVSITAWQSTIKDPIATARTHFLLVG